MEHIGKIAHGPSRLFVLSSAAALACVVFALRAAFPLLPPTPKVRKSTACKHRSRQGGQSSDGLSGLKPKEGLAVCSGPFGFA